MPRPKGSKNRINVVQSGETSARGAQGPSTPQTAEFDSPSPLQLLDEELAPAEPEPPSFWGRGALLNVRCTGGDYIVTLYPEEYDARSPERAMRFANPALCQNFVSAWYSRESHDPRAW